MRRPGSATRGHVLYCFHHAGGNAGAFMNWAPWVPPHIEVIGVQLPGRGVRLREAPLTNADEQLIPVLGEVLRAQLDGRPFAFFGHSMGAIWAFELARWLAAQSLPVPDHLFVAARMAPQLPFRMLPIDHLSEPEMVEALKRFGGVDDLLLDNPELMRLFLPIIRADLLMHRSHPHRAAPLLSCPITAIAPDADVLCSVDEMALWREHTRSTFRLQTYPGGHFFFHKQPQLYVPRFFCELWAAVGA
jgi:medium-chain acyl-[acyl-carrier-protein] hydrolase